MQPIAHIENPFVEKFGVPRQSGLAPRILSRIVFEPKYRVAEAFRGLEEYSHLWLIWEFSENAQEGDWSPTVRPPKLGGNTRLGVFATRSPFRPNPLGLSCVKLEKLELDTPEGPVLTVSGADLMNGTPIYDIKPYLPYADAHPEATGSFGEAAKERRITVVIRDETALAAGMSRRERMELSELLALDPRPGYQHDPQRVYGLFFGAYNVNFTVSEEDILTVTAIEKRH